MRSIRVVGFAAIALLGATASRLEAQGYFGQNQVQYDKFRWRVMETEHFLVHYYPEEKEAATDAARMAERAYARVSRILDHQFREKKPLILYASRADFGQNNVFGDLGEGTGGVTEAMRHRIMLPLTGDYRSFEHVLTHEMVHEFMYDIIARGRAGAGLQTLAQIAPPLWFSEGMAEFISLGPDYPITNTLMRDATINGRIPTIEELTYRPDRFNPYEFGEALWAYVAGRWGDEIIGRIMNAAPNVGIERAFRRETGLSFEELGEEWKDAMQQKHLQSIAELDRARKFAQPLLSERRSGGQIFLAPSLSNDGEQIAFLSTGSFARGEVFIDLWLGDATTGKRIKRLVKSTTNPDFEELRLLYSQSAFSPDGKYLAFTAQRKGKDVLYLMDVKKRRTIRRFDLPLEGVTSPAFSPDNKQLVFSGSEGGITDIFTVDVDGKQFRRLTRDRFGDLQPQWSPDGRSIAWASERGPQADLDILQFGKWKISVMDVQSGLIETLPGQDGHNLNPMWAPDSRSIAFVSDRDGGQNLFLFDRDSREHFQLTNLIGGVTAITEYSPAISWARGADRLAFTYYEDGDYTVWSVNNPRSLKKAPYRVPASGTPLLAQGNDDASGIAAPSAALRPDSTVTDSTVTTSLYRTGTTFRESALLPTPGSPGATQTLSVVALLDSAAFALPDTSRFQDYAYKVRFQPDYVARPSIGYAQDNFGRGVFGGTTIILSDLLGNNRLAFSGEVNGRVSEARLFGMYTNLGGRLQYATGVSQEPYYFLNKDELIDIGGGLFEQRQEIVRYIVRQVFGIAIYPLNRFSRFEAGARYNNIDRSLLPVFRLIDFNNGLSTPYQFGRGQNAAGLNYIAPYVAFVSDNTLFGYTGPIFGRRYRFQVEPTLGSFRWVEYLADYRRYDPIIFNYLTVATRVMASVSVGRDEEEFPKYIGRPEFIRGYDRENYFSNTCSSLNADPGSCSAVRLLGSRVALANAELRFPLIRRFELGILPIGLPPLDGLVFYDAGIAWSSGQKVQFRVPADPDETSLNTRYPLTSYGVGLRLNLFNYAIVRWDYAIPLDQPGREGFWTWSLGPSF